MAKTIAGRWQNRRRAWPRPRLASLLMAVGVTIAANPHPGVAAGAPAIGLGPASSSATAATVTLAGRDITATVHAEGGHFGGLTVEDANSGRSVQVAEAFTLVMQTKRVLRSTGMRVSPGSNTGSAGARKSCLTFSPADTAAAAVQPAQVTWCAVVRPDTDYVRETITITAGKQDLPMSEVHLLDFNDATAKVVGSVKGSPVVSGNMYYAFEHPLSVATVQAGHVDAAIHRVLPLPAGQSATYSAVLGTSKPGQLRRAFLAYIEKERPRPYQPFLHYNSWFDIGYTNRFSEADALDRIHAFGMELSEKRGVKLDSFLFDDGWDDPNTLWGFDSGFPHGFANADIAAAKYHAGVGVWLSPWGGYDKQKLERVAYGKAHGYEIMKGGYALSAPKYYKQFEKICLEMVDRYHVNQFKFDGTGNADSVFPGSAFDSDFDAAIHLIGRLRREKPGLFINLTTGTTPSPFWLFYADSIWRGGEDHDFSGVGTPRQRWISYRDGQTYRNIVQKGPLFPLNSLMLHGIIYAKQALDLTKDPSNDFPDEVHSYFGSGTQLQELYITPSLITPANWDMLAASARWNRAHASTLEDTHWIGGDPNTLQVYGWAAWSPHEGIVTLRNPASHAQAFDLDVSRAFELPAGAPQKYSFKDVWSPGDKRSAQFAQAQQKLHLQLAPFEVITLEGTPVR